MKDLCVPSLEATGYVTQFQKPKSEIKVDLVYLSSVRPLFSKDFVRTNKKALNSSQNYLEFTRLLTIQQRKLWNK